MNLETRNGEFKSSKAVKEAVNMTVNVTVDDMNFQNEIEKIRVRCPSCTKLYVVNSTEIKSSSPHFLCHVCHSKFTFDYPSLTETVEARLIAPSSSLNFTQRMPEVLENSKVGIAARENRHLKPCPKCGGKNAINATECVHCQVIFAKMQNLAGQDQGVRALPSLVRKWQEVLGDFENDSLHTQFIEDCRKAQALAYAIYRYRQMLEVQPQDEIAKKMLAQAQAWEMASGIEQASLPGFGKGLKQIDWLEVLYWSPAVLSGVLFLAGISNLGMRNYIGFASAVMVLWTGMSYYFNGKIGYKPKQ